MCLQNGFLTIHDDVSAARVKGKSSCVLQAILQLRPDQQEVMINLQKHFAQEIADNRKRRRGICRGLQEVTTDKMHGI